MMIPFKVKTFSFLLACACSTAGMAQVVNDSPVRQVKISGYVGTTKKLFNFRKPLN